MRMVLVLLPVPVLLMWAQSAPPNKAAHGEHFQTSDRCSACHNGLTTSTGEDISIGFAWRASLMANSSRDPYWQAGVRRETLEHPSRPRASIFGIPKSAPPATPC